MWVRKSELEEQIHTLQEEVASLRAALRGETDANRDLISQLEAIRDDLEEQAKMGAKPAKPRPRSLSDLVADLIVRLPGEINDAPSDRERYQLKVLDSQLQTVLRTRETDRRLIR